MNKKMAILYKEKENNESFNNKATMGNFDNAGI